MDAARGPGKIEMRGVVSANVHTATCARVSIGEPRENRCVSEEDTFSREGSGLWRREIWLGGFRQRLLLKKRGNCLLPHRGGNRLRMSGQSLVELAMVLPLLLILMVGVTEIGRFAYYDILVSNAARAGAQYGAQSLTAAADSNGIQTAAQNDGLDTLTVTSTQLCGCDTAPGGLGGCPTVSVCTRPLVYVQVTTLQKIDSLFKYPGLPPSLTFTNTVTMQVAQ